MDSVDLDVLKRSAAWIDEGRPVLLVTVVKTWGSSPRPEGAMLAVRDDGHVVGSVSGGCIEDDIIDRTRRLGMTQTRCEAVTYGVSADEARRFGLPCGGTIQLVLEPLTRRFRHPRAAARNRGGPSRRAPARSPHRRGDAASGAGRGWPRLRRQDADDDPRPAVPDARDRRIAVVEVPGADRRRASATRSRSATRATSTRRPGTSPASRWCGRCPTTRCARCASTSAARWSR